MSLILGISACSDSRGAERVQAPLPAPPAVVKVDMKEFAFDYDPTIPAGRVVFQVRNVGRLPHQISLLPLSESVPPIQEQIRGTRRRSVIPFAGMPAQRPRQSASLAVELKPGIRYAMICFISEEDGRSHAREGMVSEFRAGQPAGSSGRSTTSPGGGGSTTTTTTTTTSAPPS